MPTKSAAPAAKKTTAAKATKATPKPPVEDEPDLLADMPDERQAPTNQNDDDDESYDLLSDMSESAATAWMPWDESLDTEQPDKIQGKLVHIGTVQQDAKYGGDDVPYIELIDRSDPSITWGVRGYATVLRNQLEREIANGLSNGDIIALAHWGVKTNRKGDNEYRDFTVKSAKAKR